MRVGILVQVRLRSTRLSAKALLPLPGGNVIQHVMRSLRDVPVDVHALVTEPKSSAVLRPYAEAEGFLVFAGPEEDVLGRYCLAIKEYALDRVVRATGDNPLTCPALTRGILSHHRSGGFDLSHYLGIPVGTGVEVVESAALLRAQNEARDPAEREHITTYLYRHREFFRISEPSAPPGASFPGASVTVDTPQDYQWVKRIFEELYAGTPIEAAALVSWFEQAAARRLSS